MFDPFSGFWYLRSQNNSGPPDAGAFPYGLPGWRPVIGDWNGDGIDTVGVVDPSGVWYLRNSNSPGAPDIAPFPFGLGPWTPVVGDWDGDGIDGIGMVDTATGIWYLRNTPSQGPPDVGAFPYGLPGWVPVVGDWNGDGTHTLGTFDPTTGIWYLRNSNTPGGPDVVPFPYGLPGWKPVAGDWDGDKISTPGVVDPTGRWYLQNHNPATFPEIVRFPYGVGSWTPLSGTYVGQLALHAAAGEAADLAPLDPAVLQSVVTAALPRLAALETDPGVLDRVQAAGVMVANLPDNLLGLADEVNNRIWIDSDAAGNGWFLDATPFDDSEFGSDGTALAGSGAEGRIDLLSAVAHELGHLAGLEDLPGNDQDLMGAVLDTGRRRIRALDALFADGL
jgi:hypothetical protein